MADSIITTAQALQALQHQASTLHLSSYDMARFAFSRLSHQGFTPEVVEAQLSGANRLHLLLMFDDVRLDLGADNAAQFVLSIVIAEQDVTVIKPLKLAVLPESQLAFMCMETAHFDHCY